MFHFSVYKIAFNKMKYFKNKEKVDYCNDCQQSNDVPHETLQDIRVIQCMNYTII